MKELQPNPNDILPNNGAQMTASGIRLINVTTLSPLEREAFEQLLITGTFIRCVYR